jgi:hypothetical protein
MGDSRGVGPLQLRADVVATVLDDGALLLDLDSKYFYLLNPAGWAVVQLFEAGTTLERARAECSSAGADVTEVSDFVTTLLDEGLLESGTTDAAPVLDLADAWATPTVRKQEEPLQRVIVNAFDPTIPLAE